jgi:cytochrome d ubiquinol oxidase subunit II
MLDYVTLKIIWWALVGVLLIGFAIMDGHDMGVGTCCPSSAARTWNDALRSTP